ncbi:unnamed protein product [Psylliodes chrysocephalus]|uniref:Endoplasmic reticulum junction formation protein lunapark n=1 Tax=Psylliodes chrysocephalus TaxID=3402493 RepID=A0A9P0D178_9CUCU|nr:unnamed protein product [Psylliodes chrysocephala]
MGIIIGKFRKKKSTYEILEKLENEITSIEEFGRSTEQFRKKVIARFIILAFSIYFVLACILYLYYNRIQTNRKLLYFIPLIAFPFIVWFIKKFLTWYYSKKLQRNEKKIIKLKEEKKKIIDNVMETETYKVAKKILDKFGIEKKQPVQTSDSPLNANLRYNQTGLRQRQSFGPPLSNTRLSFGSTKSPMVDKNFAQPSLPTPFSQPTVSGALSARPNLALPTPSRTHAMIAASPQVGIGTPLPLPKNILPSNRSVLDKMVDYLVGDGPSNRYALICKKCSSHNGMALKEEFEYLSFNCCYCSQFNPARKKKPSGPKFETSPRPSRIAQIEDTSESDKDTADSEPEEQETMSTERRRSSSNTGTPKSVPASETTRNSSSPETERNSDFDRLSDLDYREGGDAPVVSPTVRISRQVSLNPFECDETPMDVDRDKSTTDVTDNNES